MRMTVPLITNIENRRKICIVFFDIKKAFYKLWQDKLTSNMKKIDQDHHKDNCELFNRANIQDKFKRSHIHKKENHNRSTTAINNIIGTIQFSY